MLAATVGAILCWWWLDHLPGRFSKLPAQQSGLSGWVVGPDGPLAGARVRLKGRSEIVFTDRRGRFRLLHQEDQDQAVTAWKEGYFIQGAAAGVDPLVLSLVPLPADDFADYKWVDPTPNVKEEHNCGNCHPRIYGEWSGSGHAQSARNRRLLNLYDGTDWHGNADRGWSLLADHPDGAGVCAACHAPTAQPRESADDDLRQVTGVAAQGVHCDFCHKIQNASVEGAGLTHGRFALSLLRPEEGQLFFGPLDDVDRGDDVFSPLQHESRYCAACHEGIVFGVHVYGTYSEWLTSDARREGRHCQSCHMTPTGEMMAIAPAHGGIPRDPRTLASHGMLPGGREAMLKRCLSVAVTVDRQDGRVHARVEVRADRVGHRVPTGFIDRHLILVVEALDEAGDQLQPDGGPLLPSPAGRSLAGRPGRLFAKLLQNRQGHGPVPFWQAFSDPVDTRLAPAKPVSSRFTFPVATKRIDVRLIYRRFWDEVARVKDWPDNEITVFERSFPVAEQALKRRHGGGR